MTKYLLATAASLAVLTIAASASAQTIGHVGANYGRTSADIGASDADLDVFNVEGAVRFDAGSLGAQVDGGVTYSNDFSDETSVQASGHLNTKLGNGLVGGFVGVDHSDDLSIWGLGVEGQTAVGASTTLYGQLGYGQSDDLADADIWAVRGEVRHFVTDNFRLQASVGYQKVDTDLFNTDAWNAGVEAEYQFAGTPFSVVGGYDHYKIDDANLDADTFRIGVRYTFGGTLRDQDRAGASLSSVGKLFGLGLLR